MLTEGVDHVNFSRKSTSIPFSFSRENPISKDPVAVMQRDASATTVAVHLRSSVGGRIGENATSLTARVGSDHGCDGTGLRQGAKTR